MLRGMFVTYEDQVWQILKITGAARGFYNPDPDVFYELVDATDGRLGKRVKNPTSEQMVPTPACEECAIQAGFCSGVEGKHYRALVSRT